MDMNTTAHDGTACHFCGERAQVEITVQTPRGEYRIETVPACHDCIHDLTAVCPTCEERIVQADGVRIYRSSTLHCISCAAQHPALIEGRYREMLDDTLRGNQ